MSFARPEILLFGPALVLLAVLAVMAYARRRRIVAQRLAERGLLERIGGAGLDAFPTHRAALLGAAMAAIVAAAAGPRWGTRVVEGRSQSLDLVLALDVSKSMWARDLSPDRLERERLFARRLLRELAGDRLGLVVFAGRAYVLSPLTVDHSALELYIDALDPTVVSQGGSSLSAAVVQATDLARGSTETGADRAVVLVSDGEALDDREAVLDAADRAARAGIAIYTVGVGTTAGAQVQERNPITGADEGVKRDPSGEIVVSRLDEELLREVATRTGGVYVDLAGAGAADRLLDRLQALERTQIAPGRRIEEVDRTAWLLFIALVCLVADALLGVGARLRLRRSPAIAAAVISLVLFPGLGIGDVERGNRLYRDGRYAEAVAAYEEALRDGEDSPQLRYNLGTALLRLGRRADAERHLRAGLAGTDALLRQHASYNLGNRWLGEAREAPPDAAVEAALSAAVEAYREALRIDPADADAKWNLELAQRELERQRQAAESQPQPQGGGGESEDREEQGEDPMPSGGGTAGDGEGRSPSERAPMSEEEAERILSAIEQDERDLARERLQKGQRRTPVRRDW